MLQYHACDRLLCLLMLSLVLLLVLPPGATAQPPRDAAARRRPAPVIWQEVAFDLSRFLQLNPGWYRLQNANIYFVIYPDLTSMARGLDRVAYFVEKSDTKGRIVRQENIRDNVFHGHDYSLQDLARFFHHVQYNSVRRDLFQEERELRSRLLQQGVLWFNKAGYYRGLAKTALLGFAKADQYPADTLPRPLDIYMHEIFHGLWFTTTYRQDVAAYWHRLPGHEQQSIIDILYQRGQYNPRDVPLIQREFASYFRDYRGQALLTSSTALALGIPKLEEYQHELRKIEQPYVRALGGRTQE